MGWRTVVCRSVDSVATSKGQLLLQTLQDNETVAVPLEDIDSVILENKATSITLSSLQELAQHQINLVICDDKNLPHASLTPMSQHSRSLDMLELQTSVKKPLKKSLWTRICQQKILNQASILDSKQKAKAASKLKQILSRVRSGDPTNQEAVAAGIYFKAIWPVPRRTPHQLNSLVNYGYALVRSSLARYCAGFGLAPALGIHHHASLNPFNLADDLLEPFRPAIDSLAIQYFEENAANSNELDSNAKNHMLKLLTHELPLEGGSRTGERATVSTLCHLSAQSLVEAFQKKDSSRLIIPSMSSHGAGY